MPETLAKYRRPDIDARAGPIRDNGPLSLIRHPRAEGSLRPSRQASIYRAQSDTPRRRVVRERPLARLESVSFSCRSSHETAGKCRNGTPSAPGTGNFRINRSGSSLALTCRDVGKARTRPLAESRRGRDSLGTPVSAGVLHYMLGGVIAIIELAAALTIVGAALFGTPTLSKRAFRLLGLQDESEPPARLLTKQQSPGS